MRKTSKPLGRIALAANLLWVVALLIHFIWGAATGGGLYGAMMRWQIEAGDAYSDTPMILLHLVLAMPSIWMLFGHIDARDRAAEQTPERERGIFVGTAAGMLGLAGILLATGIYCFTQAPPMRAYVEPVDITATQLMRDEYPADVPVRMWAQPVPDADYAFREIRGRTGSLQTGWRGVKALDRIPNRLAPLPAPSGPVAVFSEATSAERSAPENLADVISVSGRVVKNGLPDLARRRLAEAGVTIADPHYVLRHSEEEGGGWITGGLLALFFAFACGMIGAVLLLRGLGAIGVRARG